LQKQIDDRAKNGGIDPKYFVDNILSMILQIQQLTTTSEAPKTQPTSM
jgi:hypothetical protein